MKQQNSEEHDNPVIRFEHPSDILPLMTKVTQLGMRTLDIFSHSLNAAIYNDTTLMGSVVNLVQYSARSKVRILVRNSKHLNGNACPLIALAQRIPSKCSIRAYTEGAKNPDMGFFCIDRKHLIYFNDEMHFKGFCRINANPESKSVLDEFEHLWIYGSKEDPNLRRLSI